MPGVKNVAHQASLIGPPPGTTMLGPTLHLVAIAFLMLFLGCEVSEPASIPTPIVSAESLVLVEHEMRILELSNSVDELTFRLEEMLESPNPDSGIWIADVTAIALKLQAPPEKSESLTEADSLREFREIEEVWATQYADIGMTLSIGIDIYASGQTIEGLALIRTAERALADIDYGANLYVPEYPDYLYSP